MSELKLSDFSRRLHFGLGQKLLFNNILLVLNIIYILVFAGENVKFKGTEYKVGDFLIMSDDEAFCITQIFASSENDTAVVKSKSHLINFIPSLRAFQLMETQEIYNNNLITDFPSTPRNTHKVLNKNYIIHKNY